MRALVWIVCLLIGQGCRGNLTESSGASPTPSTVTASAPTSAPTLSGAASTTQEAPLVFRATLRERPRLATSADASGNAWSVGIDARWIVVMQIDEIVTGAAPFERGSTQAFRIHSPAQLLRGDEGQVGSGYTFRASVVTAGERPRFQTLVRIVDP